MGIIGRIADKVNVLMVVYDQSDNYTVTHYTVDPARGSVHVVEERLSGVYLSKYPSVILLAGYGVISKSLSGSTETVEKIMSDTENFLWNYSPDKNSVVFVRRPKIEPLHEYLAERAAKILVIECICEAVDDEARFVGMYMQALCPKIFTAGNIFKPSDLGSVLAQHLFNRLKMPVLVVVLVLLIFNFFAGNNLDKRRDAIQGQLAALQKVKSAQEQTSRSRQQSINQFHAGAGHRYALMCDHIGAAVPENIILTFLSIQPLSKALANNKAPILAEDTVLIRGEAKAPDDISVFISSLKNISGLRDVTLQYVEKSNDHNLSIFQISIAL